MRAEASTSEPSHEIEITNRLTDDRADPPWDVILDRFVGCAAAKAQALLERDEVRHAEVRR